MTDTPPQSVSPYEQTNDSNGYAVYSVVVMADLQQQASIERVRKAVGNMRSMIPAHVTVKGTFCQVADLNDLISTIKQIAQETVPFEVQFKPGGPEKKTSTEGSEFATQPIEKTSELVRLHERLYDAISPVTTLAYGREDGGHYWPHMTIYSEPSQEPARRADQLLADLDIGDGYHCEAMFLMGHVGRPYRGRWTVLREFPFGASQSTQSAQSEK